MLTLFKNYVWNELPGYMSMFMLGIKRTNKPVCLSDTFFNVYSSEFSNCPPWCSHPVSLSTPTPLTPLSLCLCPWETLPTKWWSFPIFSIEFKFNLANVCRLYGVQQDNMGALSLLPHSPGAVSLQGSVGQSWQTPAKWPAVAGRLDSALKSD